MVKANNMHSYYITGIKEKRILNDFCTFIFVKENYNSEEIEIPIVLKVKKQMQGIKCYDKVYVGEIKSVDVTKDKSGMPIVVVECDAHIDYASLVIEDYYEYWKNDMDTWFSPI